jgi:hypothetical protein
MAEAVAALSLASNVLQIIDSGTKFASIAWKIYHSGRVASASFDDLEYLPKINFDLQGVLKDLRGESTSQNVSQNHRCIIDLAVECGKIAEELTKSLGQIHANSLGHIHARDEKRKRDAIKLAFRSMWKEKEINSLQERLVEHRHQLTLHLLVSLR